MSVAEYRNKHRFHHLILTDDHTKYLVAALLVALKKGIDGFFVGGKGYGHFG
jgi:coenzyme F420-reducing hydrogenase delta subunit